MPRDLIANPEIVVPAALDADGEILERAADLIERHGWRQCALGHGIEVPHCVLGALIAACGLDPGEHGTLPPHGVYERAYKALGGDPVKYNNTPGRTAAEVITRLRAAARGAL